MLNIIQKRLSEQKQEMDKIWTEISKDYSLPFRIAQLAKYFLGSGLDIRQQKQIDLLRKKDPQTGRYVPLGLHVPAQDPTQLSKDKALAFLLELDQKVQDGTPWIDFNNLSTGHVLTPYALKGKSYVLKPGIDIDEEGNPPQEVPKPGIFKMFFYNWLGFFKDEVDRYNAYLDERSRYDAKEQTRSAMKAVATVPELAEIINGIKEAREAENLIREEKPPTLEETLTEAVKKEKEKLQCVDLVTGRRNDRLYFGENFQKITETPMADFKSVKMGGLALLAACSETFNKGIVDQSTQIEETFQDNPQLTMEEKELAKKIEAASVRTNVAAKILDSLFSGTENNRMNDRMKAVIQGREALTAAMYEYAQPVPDRSALANLLKDCLPSVYYNIGANSRLGDARNAAVIEIAEAVTDLFEKDPTLKQMVNFPEDRLQAIRGAANYYKLGAAPAEEKLSRYKADDGPGGSERKKTVEKLLVRNILKKLQDTQQNNINDMNALAIFEKTNTQEFSDFVNKYENKSVVLAGITSLISEEIAQVPELLKQMGQKNFDMNTVTEPLLAEIRKLPEYNTLISMEKDQLFSEDFSTLGANCIKAITEKSAVKEKEQVKTTAAERRQEAGFVITGNIN